MARITVRLGEIQPSEVSLRELLGEGAFAQVFRASCRGRMVAVKKLKGDLDKETVVNFLKEMEVYRNVIPVNVVQFLGACLERGNMFIVSELMSRNLKQALDDRNLSKADKLRMMKDVAVGLEWLQSNGFIHRDLKPENLLLDDRGTAKIGDFGFSVALTNRTQEFQDKSPKGTILYMAPEVIANRPFGTSSDIFSFGVIMWEVFSGLEPWENLECREDVEDAVRSGERPPIEECDCSKYLRDTIESCWAQDPAARPDSHSLVRVLEWEIISEVASDEGVAKFWYRYFSDPLTESIDQDAFFEAISEELEVPDDTIHSLWKICCGRGREVSLQTFNRLSLWHGHFFEDLPTLESMLKLYNGTTWFHGLVSSAREAEDILLHQRELPRAFLVRPSITDPKSSPFTISQIEDGKVQHIRVKAVNGLLEASGIQNPGLIELVDALSDKLGKPCPPVITQAVYQK